MRKSVIQPGMPPRSGGTNGFTLLELSIVVGISALITVAILRMFHVYDVKAREERGYKVMANADAALAKFYDEEGRYPCPARNLAPTDTNYGAEDCSITPVAGARDTNGNGMTDDTVLIGQMPAYATVTDENDSAPAAYFDDKVSFTTRVPVPLWGNMQIGGITQDSISTQLTGNVGIRTSSPREKLEIGKWEDVNAGTAPELSSTIKADRVTYAKQICDAVTGQCFTPQSFVNLGCGTGQYMQGIDIVPVSGGLSELHPNCQNLAFEGNGTPTTCNQPGLHGYMTGVWTDGTAICGIRVEN